MFPVGATGSDGCGPGGKSQVCVCRGGGVLSEFVRMCTRSHTLESEKWIS